MRIEWPILKMVRIRWHILKILIDLELQTLYRLLTSDIVLEVENDRLNLARLLRLQANLCFYMSAVHSYEEQCSED